MSLLSRISNLFSKTIICKPKYAGLTYETCPQTVPDFCNLYLSIKNPSYEQTYLFAKNITPLLKSQSDCEQLIEFVKDDAILVLISFEKQNLKKIRMDLMIFKTIIRPS